MYELFEHTADLGLRIRAADLEGLYGDAARGLFAIIAGEIPPDESDPARGFSIRGDRRDYLLLDWLTELLFVFETEHLLLHDFTVRIVEDGLRATARAQPLDRSRHRTLHEVKAITYHGLKVEPAAGGWLAEVIVDI